MMEKMLKQYNEPNLVKVEGKGERWITICEKYIELIGVQPTKRGYYTLSKFQPKKVDSLKF